MGVMVTDGVMVRFGRLVRGGKLLERCDEEVAGVMVVPAAKVAPAGSDDRGGGSMELLPLRCWPLMAAAAIAEAAAAAELELPVRLLVALQIGLDIMLLVIR